MKSDGTERKLKIENLERCMNCKLFTRCPLIKDDAVCCSNYQEVEEKEQVVIIGLERYREMTEYCSHK